MQIHISKVRIKNFRNLKDVDVSTEKVTALIGDNNSGKSNFLYALTLPLLADEIHYGRKRLNWTDINIEVKDSYYSFLEENKEDFSNNDIPKELFLEHIPEIKIIIEFEYDTSEYYLVKDLLSEVNENGRNRAAIQYSFHCNDVDELVEQIKNIFNNENVDKIINVEQNLLPMELFEYSITIPGRDKKISYELLSKLSYNFISTDRDNFSSTNSRLGSNNLVKILNNKLSTEDKITVESQYNIFFEQIKSLANMDEIMNWQEYSDIKNAKEFFEKISILPNMPPMTSLLNSVNLGYEDYSLSSQGLGYRNLILLTVMINSLMNNEDKYYSMLSIEEPEAHLSYENQLILISYLKAVSSNKESVQVFYSTHDVNFINKLDLKNILIFNKGKVVSLKDELTEGERNYISLNPNLDLFKLFFSNRCILVEGITEELFIKSYLHNSNENIYDIQVLSFHKGYRKIMDIWLKLYEGTDTKLGIIRDFDDQPNAQDEHHEYNKYENICVATTSEYTLEPEIVSTGNNFKILNTYFNKTYDWPIHEDVESLSNKWRKEKSSTMIDFSKDLSNDKVPGFQMPKHIADVLDFMGIDIVRGSNGS